MGNHFRSAKTSSIRKDLINALKPGLRFIFRYVLNRYVRAQGTEANMTSLCLGRL